MKFLSRIFGGGASTVLDSVGRTAEVFVGNKAQREMGRHLENMAVHDQYAAEFQYRGNRTLFDSIIDGLNRLPRPLITFAVLGSMPGSIYMIFNYPTEFRLLVEALAILPSGLWMLFSMVVGFYFAGRMQIKAKDFKVEEAGLERFNAALIDYKKSKSAEDDSIDDIQSSANSTIDAFNNSRRAPSMD